MATTNGVVRLAALSDVHYGKTSQGTLHALFDEITGRADVLVICGDLTDYGLPEEAKILAKDITAAVKIPTVAVLGNHDFESDKQDEVAAILRDAGVSILDGDAVELQGVGFAGIKGFAGGFGRAALGAWGEPSIKHFVHETIEEALKLEAALARLRTPQRIALLHYSPVKDTVEGEPVEIFPWLGCSRLEEPLGRFSVTAVFHGHAHNGAPEGKSSTGVPVYNVALPLLRKCYPDRPPYRLLEIPVATSDAPVSGDEDAGASVAATPAPEWRRRASDRG